MMPRGRQQSVYQDQYPDAWQAYLSTPSSLDGALAARNILMQQYGLPEQEVDSVVAAFIMAGRTAMWVEKAAASSTPCAVEIGDPQREIEITPLQPPVPLPAPDPEPAPERAPERVPEKEPARVGFWVESNDDLPAEDQAGDTYLEPIYGERTLFVKAGSDGQFYLESGGSGGHPHKWQPGVAAVAKCATGSAHEAPDKSCRCGFYTVDHDHIDAMQSYTHDPYVIVKLSLWGKVDVHEYGQRSQYAYPYEIRVPPNLIWFDKYSSEQVAQGLARTYQVDASVQPAPWPMDWGHLPLGWEPDPEVVAELESTPRWDLGNGWTVNEALSRPTKEALGIRPEHRDEHAFMLLDNGKLQGYILADIGNGYNVRPDGKKDFIINAMNVRPEAKHAVQEFFQMIRTESGLEPMWSESSEQGMNENYPYSDPELVTDPDQYFAETETVDDVDSLISLYRDLNKNYSAYTETTPLEDYTLKKRLSDKTDEYGLPQWEYHMKEYPPVFIEFPFNTWRQIVEEILSELQGATDPSTARKWTPDQLIEIAKALYEVPVELAQGDVSRWSGQRIEGEDWGENIQAILHTIDQLDQEAGLQDNFNQHMDDPTQRQRLFDDTQYYFHNDPIKPGIHQDETRWFLSYLRELFTQGNQNVDYKDLSGNTQQMQVWGEPSAPPILNMPNTGDWQNLLGDASGGAMQLPGTMSKTATDEDKPKWSFMYYKSALEVVPWSHNVRYRDIAHRLLNKFNTRLEDGGWKDDEGEWSGGDIYVEDDGLRVEFKHLASPDIQSSALIAIRHWYDDESREKSEIDWEMDGEETRKEARITDVPSEWHYEPDTEDMAGNVIKRHLREADDYLERRLHPQAPVPFRYNDFSHYYHNALIPGITGELQTIPPDVDTSEFGQQFDRNEFYRNVKSEDWDDATDATWQFRRKWTDRTQAQELIKKAQTEPVTAIIDKYLPAIYAGWQALTGKVINRGNNLYTAMDNMKKANIALERELSDYASMFLYFKEGPGQDRYDWQEEAKEKREALGTRVYNYYSTIQSFKSGLSQMLTNNQKDFLDHSAPTLLVRLKRAEKSLNSKPPPSDDPQQSFLPPDWSFHDWNAPKEEQEPDWDDDEPYYENESRYFD